MANIKKNFIYQSFWQVLIMILPLITSPILARVLGAEGVGIYSYTYSIASYFVLILNLGIDTYGNREIAKVKKDKKLMSRTFCEIYLVHLILSFIVLNGYVIYVVFFAKYKLYAGIQILNIFGAMLGYTWLFSGLEEFKIIVTRDTIIKLGTVALVILCLKESSDLWKYTLIMSVSTLVSSLVFWIYIKKTVTYEKVKLKNLIKHIKPIFILFIPAALESIYNVLDKIMLGIMDSEISVGFYENATKALIAKTLIFSLGTVMMPRMATLIQEKNNEKIDSYMKQSTEFTMILSFAFAFGTAAIAREFSVVFWGDEFDVCAPLILIMAFSLPFQTLANEIRTHCLIPAAKDKDYMLSAAAGGISNIILNLLLIPKYGAIGAALATLTAHAVVLLVQLYVIRNSIPMIRYMKGSYVYIIPSVIMFFIVWYIGKILGPYIYTLFIQISVGILIYGAFCFIYWKKSNKSYYLNLIEKLLNIRRVG